MVGAQNIVPLPNFLRAFCLNIIEISMYNDNI
jgi:hypothetical protein